MDSLDLSSAIQTWKKVAASECMLSVMMELLKMGVGFAGVEEMNIDLTNRFRSMEFKERAANGEIIDEKVIQIAMESKLRDEKKTRGKLEKNLMKT